MGNHNRCKRVARVCQHQLSFLFDSMNASSKNLFNSRGIANYICAFHTSYLMKFVLTLSDFTLM